MNNREQKNVIYGLESRNVLPYKMKQDVQTKSESFRSAQINNIFQQLIDNDTFIENKIKVSGKNMDGPSRYTDDQIKDLENGSKVLSASAASEQLLILRKEEKNMQESLERVLAGKINILCKYDKELLIGSSEGLFSTEDGIKF
jgi:hypothetical protein